METFKNTLGKHKKDTFILRIETKKKSGQLNVEENNLYQYNGRKKEAQENED